MTFRLSMLPHCIETALTNIYDAYYKDQGLTIPGEEKLKEIEGDIEEIEFAGISFLTLGGLGFSATYMARSHPKLSTFFGLVSLATIAMGNELTTSAEEIHNLLDKKLCKIQVSSEKKEMTKEEFQKKLMEVAVEKNLLMNAIYKTSLVFQNND